MGRLKFHERGDGDVMADLDLKLLARILGRMQSTHDNETLIAARAATRMVREAGLSWDEVVRSDRQPPDADPIGASQVIEHPTRGPLAPPVGRQWQDTLQWLCERRAGRTSMENALLDSLARKLGRQKGIVDKPWIRYEEAAKVVEIYEATAIAGGNAA